MRRISPDGIFTIDAATGATIFEDNADVVVVNGKDFGGERGCVELATYDGIGTSVAERKSAQLTTVSGRGRPPLIDGDRRPGRRGGEDL